MKFKREKQCPKPTPCEFAIDTHRSLVVKGKLQIGAFFKAPVTVMSCEVP